MADELIYIDDVGPQTIGESFTLTGSAELPAGTVLHIRIVPVDDGGISISAGPSKEMVWGDAVIEKGPGETGGVWNYTVNTSNLLPIAYFVRVYSDDVKYPYSERATAFTAHLPMIPEPTASPLSLVGVLGGLGCATALVYRIEKF